MHHNKVLELLVLVVIGAGLVPLHHRLEKVVIAKLTKPRLTVPAADATEIAAEAEEGITEGLPLTAANISFHEEEQENTEQKKSAPAADTTEAEEK
jgi:hypothetical protein